MEPGIPFLLTVELEGGAELRSPVARLQILARKFGFKPTWLVGISALQHPSDLEALARWQSDGEAEVGVQLDAERVPPLVEPGDLAGGRRPAITDFPERMIEEKVGLFSEALEKSVGKRPTSIRVVPAAVDDRYYSALAKAGFKVDLSVAPHVKSDPHDFSGYSERPYLTPQGILEIPRTVRKRLQNPLIEDLSKLPAPWGLAVQRFFPSLRCLRLRPGNMAVVRQLLLEAERTPPEHLDLRITLKNDRRASTLVRFLERFLLIAQPRALGLTAEEFYRRFKTQQLRKDLV